jgi:hypothetical protein
VDLSISLSSTRAGSGGSSSVGRCLPFDFGEIPSELALLTAVFSLVPLAVLTAIASPDAERLGSLPAARRGADCE